MRLWLILSGINGVVAIAAGAFGAHGLQSIANDARLSAFETGANYHLLHAIALLGLAAIAARVQSKAVMATGWLWLAGTLMFAVPLYIFGITGDKTLIMVTPIGGTTLMIGWLMLAIAGYRALPDQS